MRRVLALAISVAPGCIDVPPADEVMTDSSGGPTTTESTSTATTGSTTTTESTTSTTGSTTSGSTTADPTSGLTSDATGSDTSSTGDSESVICPQFFDSFEADVIDERWLLEYPESVSQANGQMTINITAENGDQFARAMVQPESGIETTTISIEITQPPTIESTQLILYVEADGDARIAFTVNVAAGNTTLEVRFTGEDGTQQAPLYSDTYDEQNHRWLRIVESGGDLSFQVSPDGTNYTPVYSQQTPFAVDNARVGVVGNNFALLPGGDSEVSIGEFGVQCAP